MTVIACRDGVLAADTARWSGDVIVGHVNKVMRLADGSLFAGQGIAGHILKIAEWLPRMKDGAPKPFDKSADFNGIWLRSMGVWIVEEDLTAFKIESEFQATGCHADFLRGCMAAGASAEEAVRLAIRDCAYAAGEMTSARLR